ncbi:uncharacterized protein EDB91DRAFT_1081562 [Suillus paluster]|uniref:uncharacterized protein n=1 Tax=Suillus paluster TaxID=48578 RepID=UPI001B86BE9E|nr:uncharacterized protein EDB91DRAFT_1081562 [Suillus paluster]KAG1742404.1 hypothetical protein EDB91DRAFT_1081562 [Suillus paluster]
MAASSCEQDPLSVLMSEDLLPLAALVPKENENISNPALSVMNLDNSSSVHFVKAGPHEPKFGDERNVDATKGTILGITPSTPRINNVQFIDTSTVLEPLNAFNSVSDRIVDCLYLVCTSPCEGGVEYLDLCVQGSLVFCILNFAD